MHKLMKSHLNIHRGVIVVIPKMLVIFAVGVLMMLPFPGIGSAASLTPGRPLHVSATTGTSTVKLHWTSASSPAKFPVLKYVVTSSPASRGCHVAARRSRVFTCVVSGLKIASRYNFFIKAQNIYGFGALTHVVIRTRGRSTGPVPTTTTTLPPVRSLVLWSFNGSGSMSGPKFTVPSQAKSWTENWSYDCTSLGTTGNFITSITGYGGSSGTTDVGANELGLSGSGTNYYFDTGTFNIQVNSECNWTESVGSF